MVLDIVIPIVAAILAGIAATLVKGKWFRERSVFPTTVKPTQAYSALNDQWYRYHLTFDSTESNKPFWTCHREKLRVVDGIFIEGESENIQHRTTQLKYRVRGEIRGGRMLLTYNGIHNPSEFSTAMYPNLLGLAGGQLVGTWSGFDFQLRPVTGPIILSKKEGLSAEDAELDRIARTAPHKVTALERRAKKSNASTKQG